MLDLLKITVYVGSLLVAFVHFCEDFCNSIAICLTLSGACMEVIVRNVRGGYSQIYGSRGRIGGSKYLFSIENTNHDVRTSI